MKDWEKRADELEREITELKAENSSYDKGISDFFMWLGAKMRENQLIDPGTTRDELRERLKSKETKSPKGSQACANGHRCQAWQQEHKG